MTSDAERQRIARRILSGGPPIINRDAHFDGCPARDGLPICSCDGIRYANKTSKGKA